MTTTLHDEQPMGTAWARRSVDFTRLLQALGAAPGCVVAIPVFNGGQAVARCLASAIANTFRTRILVIDDASTDPAIIELLDRRQAEGLIDLVRHDENRGYTATVNHALELCRGDDLILLNSDTEVGPLWHQRLRAVAYSLPDVASVTAASDNAGAMSLPIVGQDNVWPDHLPWNEISRLVARRFSVWAQSLPTANGFCTYIRREAVDAVGVFDLEAFPRGYGEENDWSMRAAAAGYVNLFAPHVFVRHARSQSFGEERTALAASGRQTVDRRHPDYTAQIQAWRTARSSTAIASEASAIQATATATDEIRPRRLYVVHRSVGGTPATNMDLIGTLTDQQDAFLLESQGGTKILLSSVVGGRRELITTWEPSTKFTMHDRWDDDYAAFVADVLTTYGIEVIHVRHLIHTPIRTLPEVARLLGVRLIYSTHDFHAVCPTITLLDEQNAFCGGHCTPGRSNCTLPEPVASMRDEPLKNGWVHEWRRDMEGVMDWAEAVVATTPTAGAIIKEFFPAAAQKLQVIEHGRDLTDFAPARAATRRPGPMRVLAPAIWAEHKGLRYVHELATRVGDSVEWHFLGRGSDQLAGVGIPHGEYSRDNLVRLTQAVDPDFIGLFSIWAETYSHTLTEAWGMGVPVLATDIGAFRDRIKAWGGGQLLPLSPAEAAPIVLAHAQDDAAVRRLRLDVSVDSIRHHRSMANDYRRLYEHSPLKMPLIGVLDVGEGQQSPPSAHVRVLRRAVAARSLGLAHYERLVARDYAAGTAGKGLDSLVIVRNGLRPEFAAQVLDRAKQEGVRVVLDIDDDLISDHAIVRLVDQGWSALELNGLRETIRRVDHVVTSTVNLSRLMSELNDSTSVLPNELDGRLWARDVAPLPQPDAAEDELRVLYMGNPTHAEDLLLLEGVFDSVSDALGRRVTLEVVGVTSGDGISGMRRLQPRRTDYAGFSTWLRQTASRWQAAVAPLKTTEFNRYKSDLKLLEYGMLGLPAIASDFGPYAGRTDLARLVDPSPSSWSRALIEVLTKDTYEAAQVRELVSTERMLNERSVMKWLASLI